LTLTLKPPRTKPRGYPVKGNPPAAPRGKEVPTQESNEKDASHVGGKKEKKRRRGHIGTQQKKENHRARTRTKTGDILEEKLLKLNRSHGSGGSKRKEKGVMTMGKRNFLKKSKSYSTGRPSGWTRVITSLQKTQGGKMNHKGKALRRN